MEIIQRRAGIRIEGADHAFDVAFPINAVLGLRDKEYYKTLDRQAPLSPTLDQENYLRWLEVELGGIGREERTAREGREAPALVKDGTYHRLVSAAESYQQSLRIPYPALADLLAEVTILERGKVDIPSLAVLGAWSLQQAAARGDRVARCKECRLLWFTGAMNRDYCSRPAPGRKGSCAQLQNQRRFADRRDEWDKEYRRIYARKLRGTVGDKEWAAWREDPRGSQRAPDNWIPFDVWKEAVSHGKHR